MTVITVETTQGIYNFEYTFANSWCSYWTCRETKQKIAVPLKKTYKEVFTQYLAERFFIKRQYTSTV